VGYGPLESYGFHSLETGQFVVEQRAGGEVGVKSVQCLQGQSVWDAQKAGRWPQEIAEASLSAVQKPRGKPQDYAKGVYAFDVEYRDGQRMTVIMPGNYCNEFGFAYRVTGSKPIIATAYELDEVPRLKHFSATVRALEEMYITGKPIVPAARTYLTTGILAYLMESHFQGGVKLETPDLAVSYRAPKLPAEWKEVLH
jgi:hypothetical protein